jgi:hypothetical protein
MQGLLRTTVTLLIVASSNAFSTSFVGNSLSTGVTNRGTSSSLTMEYIRTLS